MHLRRLSQRAHWKTLYYLIDASSTSFFTSAVRNLLTFSRCILDVFRCEHSQIAIHTISKSYSRSSRFRSTIVTSKLFSSFENVQLKIKARSILSDKDVVDEEEKSSFDEKRLDKEELRSQEDVQLKIKARSTLSDKDVVNEEEKLSFDEKRLDKEELRRLEYVDNDIDQENVHQNLSQRAHEKKMSINLIESSQLHRW